MFIKLCGMMRPEDILAANDAQPDAVGFVFAPGRRRTVSVETAAAMRTLLKPGIRAVGVFVDQPPEEVAEIAMTVPLDAVQLHGHEDADYIQTLRLCLNRPTAGNACGEMTDEQDEHSDGETPGKRDGHPGGAHVRGTVSIGRAIVVRREEDALRAEASAADWILLDSGTGTGRSFNWNLIRDMKRPYLLAGGLNPDNAAEAVRQLQPSGLDVSSGIETDGRKDPAKMRAFVRAARAANGTYDQRMKGRRQRQEEPL